MQDTTELDDSTTDDGIDAGPERGDEHLDAAGAQPARTRARPIDEPSFHARRGALYGYLAAAFQYPDETVQTDLRDSGILDAVAAAASAIAEADPTADSLPVALADLETVLEDTPPDDTRAAYNALFGLPSESGSYPVIPYEANYTTTGDVNEMQRRIATIVGLLERFGLEPHEEFDERQDHVAILLELMQVAAVQRASALEAGRHDDASTVAAAEATILDEHLTSFVPALAHDVEDVVGLSDPDAAAASAADDTGGDDTGPEAIYREAADLAAALVRWDAGGRPEPSVDPADGTGGESA